MAKYIRNLRPNRVNLRVAGLKLGLDRRGARGDSLPIPDDAFSDRVIRDYISRGLIEEISEEKFFALSARSEDEDIENIGDGELRRKDEYALKKLTPVVRYTLNPDNKPDQELHVKEFKKEWMTPSLEYQRPEVVIGKSEGENEKN